MRILVGSAICYATEPYACIATIFELTVDKASNQTGPVPVFLDTLICLFFFNKKGRISVIQLRSKRSLDTLV